MENNFTDRIIGRCKTTGSHVAVELAPSIENIPEFITQRFESVGAVLYAYCKGIIDGIADFVPGIILPIYMYEAYGIGGMVAMDAVAKYAASKGLVVIADGGFGGSKEAVMGYVKAYLGGASENIDGEKLNRQAGEGCFFADAVTLSPYSDAEGIKEAAAFCMEHGKGIFVNVRTTDSNEKVHFENIKTAENDEPLYKSAADDSGAFGRNFIGKNGYGVIGMSLFAQDDAYEIRKINKWGIALVKAQNVNDFSDERLYRYFYEDDGQGALLVVRSAVCDAWKKDSSEFGAEEYGEAARVAAQEITKKSEAMIAAL